MPFFVLIVLVVTVGTYILLTGAASLGFITARRQDSPPDPSEWPTVSVVVPGAAPPNSDSSNSEILQQIRSCNYPSGRLELLVLTDGSIEHSPPERGGAATVRRISVPERTPGLHAPWSTLQRGIEAAEGKIILSMSGGDTGSPQWIRSMVRHCTSDTPVVVGPTIIEHGDLFLPRLQALQHLGRLAFTGGASSLGLPTQIGPSNLALHTGAFRPESCRGAPTEFGRVAVFNPATDAAVRHAPVSSFAEFFRRQARWFRRATETPSRIVQGQAAGLWLVHTVLLACSLVAVAAPAWRQPTLIALVGKMGADIVLSLPAAKHYGQRPLLRSIVPSELMLVLTIPGAGIWSLLGSDS